MVADPIQRRKLYQEILDRLMARISAGEFAPGAPLPSERELMETYGVGRPAVREALQHLERSGIITISHGERARVALPTAEILVEQMAGAARYLLSREPGSLEHLKEARLFLETGLARLAAARADEAGIALLRQRLEEHRSAGPSEFLLRDIAFHRQIAAMTGNPIFPAIIDGMLSWLGEYHRSLVRVRGAESLTLAEHQRICDAIAARDPAEAERAMHDHLTRVNALYQRFTEGD